MRFPFGLKAEFFKNSGAFSFKENGPRYR